MKPEHYFPKLYKEDLLRLSGDDRHTSLLCSGTFEHIREDNIKLNFFEAFFSCQYALNLIGQGIHCYYKDDEYNWMRKSVPFLDMRMCASHHGGIFVPKDILRYADIPHEMLAEYVNYFFFQYLPSLDLNIVTADALISCLRSDDDCGEINDLIVVA